MKMGVRRCIAGIATVVAAVGAGGGIASAAAVPVQYDSCYTWGTSNQTCITGHGVFGSNETPDGTVHYFTNSRVTYRTFVDGVVISETTATSHTFYQTDADETSPYRSSGSYTYPSGGQTCTVAFNMTYANGEVRHDAFEATCV
jgi:hypothetical protein